MIASGRRLLLPLLPLVMLVFPSAISAHVLDAYVQATLVDIEPGDIRLQINLTPGVEIADQVLALIDRDRDGVISMNEGAAYAELFKHDLVARFDDRTIELKLTESKFPSTEELRTGMGIIQIEFAMTPGSLAAGGHKLTLDNRHLPKMGVYLFNASQPRATSIQITRQNRNQNQSWGEIQFAYHPSTKPAGVVGFAAAGVLVAVLAGVWRTRKNSPASRHQHIYPSSP